MRNKLEKRELNGGCVTGSYEAGFKFIIPPIADRYCLAQLDNYMQLSRNHFPHHPPLRIQVKARVSTPDLPGTWGFGLWNDPLSFGFGMGGMTRLLPVMPNAAWFFYGSPANSLSLREDHPRSGFHAKVFKSPRFPGLFSLLALPAIPLLLMTTTSRLLRRLARVLIKEDACQIDIPETEWHLFNLSWFEDQVTFYVDGINLFRSSLSPHGPMGLVIWMDNQYLCFDSSGKLSYGLEKIAQQQWLQIRHLHITSN